jgi:hypothetical protein
MRESVIEKHLVKRVKELGGEVRKVQWIGRRGAPDRLVMLPDFWWHCMHGRKGNPGPIYVELKAPGEVPEPHQLREHQRMRGFHIRVEVIDSIEGVERLLG